MTRNAIIERVKVKLDEITPEEETQHPGDIYIESLIDEAARNVLRTANVNLVRHDNIPVTTDMVTQSDSVVSVKLPSTVLKPVSAKLPTWQRKITEFALEGDMTDVLQHDAYTRGTPLRPVVVFSQTPTERILECYTHPAIVDVTTIKITGINYKKAEEINEELIDALVLNAAYLVSIVIGRTKEAEIFLNEYKQLI